MTETSDRRPPEPGSGTEPEPDTATPTATAHRADLARERAAAFARLTARDDWSDQAAVLAEINPLHGELAERMGLVITRYHPESVVATMPVDGNRQPFGLLHGGANGVLAESVGSMHAALLGQGRSGVGIELSCSHLRPAVDGLVTATSVPVSVGRTLATFAIEIVDDGGRPTCAARLTCLYR